MTFLELFKQGGVLIKKLFLSQKRSEVFGAQLRRKRGLGGGGFVGAKQIHGQKLSGLAREINSYGSVGGKKVLLFESI